MAYYKNQIIKTIIDTSTLTNSYDNNIAITDVRGFNMITLYIEYTPQEVSSYVSIQIESGIDDSNLYPKAALLDKDLSGESTTLSHILKIDSSGSGTMIKKRIMFEVADIKARISLKETVSSTYGTCKVNILKNEQ